MADPDGRWGFCDRIVVALVATELHDAFCGGTGKHTPCCRILTRGLEWTSPERTAQCQAHCALAAAETARILCRELGIQLES